MAKKKRKTKKKSVVDSGVRNAGLLSDGCNPELVKDVLSLMVFLKFQ